MIKSFSTAAAVVVTALSLWSHDVEACGCFAPPDPTVPIVQAGERILFSVENGVVTAHIQIQYAGDAKDFGWLLPLPSVPSLKLGTEELFTQLIATTQPRYFVTTSVNGNCGGGFLGGLANSRASSAPAAEDSAGGGSSPLVIQSSVGPYDYAVLKADNKDAMLKWLNDNRYFIPTGTEDVVGPYIQPGAYFLALKLKSGKSTGDIAPVVLTYPSQLPMIPIILTSVAAQPNMGIQVWMLGNGRAIPRNYHHVIVNDALIDWLNTARNYNDVVIKAVSEAPEKHAFVTEYAGPSDVMRDVLDPVGRFGTQADLASQDRPVSFVQYLFDHDFAPAPAGQQGRGFFGQPTLPPALKSLVLATVPVPPALRGQTIRTPNLGTVTITDDTFLSQLGFILGSFRDQNPSLFVGYPTTFDLQTLAAEVFTKVVTPAREAGALFKKFPTLTRLYTTLSPQDMSKDPVFSFNPSLLGVSRDHTANLQVNCGLAGTFSESPARLVTEQGWIIKYPRGQANAPEATFASGPGALRIETLAEEGNPTVTLDNTPPLEKLQSSGCGCSTVDPLGVGLFAIGAMLRRRRAS
jgi:hypothetical protein